MHPDERNHREAEFSTRRHLVTAIVTLASFNRRISTTSGGLRYALLTDNGHVYLTANDTADSYGWVPERLTGIPVRLTLDRAWSSASSRSDDHSSAP